MEFDLDFGRRARCGTRKREQCARTAVRIVALAEKSRREGLLSLEEELAHIEHHLLRDAFQLIVDGTDPAIVRSILEVRIASGSFRGAELLERCLVLEGALAVQAGQNPRLVEMRLASFFGDGGAELLRSIAGAREGAPEVVPPAEGHEVPPGPAAAPASPARVPPETESLIREIADMLEKRLQEARTFQEKQIVRSSGALQEMLGAAGFTPPVSPGQPDVEVHAIRWLAGRSPAVLAALPSLLPGPGGEALLSRIVTFDRLLFLSDRDMQKLLRETDSSLLARALKGAPETAAKAYRNMSTRAAALLKEDMQHTGPVDPEAVLSAQQAILKNVWLLVERGEIRPPPTGELVQ